MFPSDEDTQAGVNVLEHAKTWPGWHNLKTVAQVKKNRQGKLQIHRVTIAMPLARYLLAEYGEFLLVDCTFKLTIYVGRYHIFISVIDRYGHVHPVIISEVPGHREKDWLHAFNNGWDLVEAQASNELRSKPKTAFLMKDGEGAITTAWRKSKWPQHVETGECTKHGQWSAQKQKMSNGVPFGPERGQVWYGLLFKTCYRSFMDGVGETIAAWKSNGDNIGAAHLQKLAQTSTAPLFRWSPIPAPGISAQSAEALNYMVKKTPKDGTRRQKQTFFQFSRTVVKLGVRVRVRSMI